MRSFATFGLEHFFDKSLDDINDTFALLPDRVKLPLKRANSLLNLHAHHLVEPRVLLGRCGLARCCCLLCNCRSFDLGTSLPLITIEAVRLREPDLVAAELRLE